MKKLNLGCGNKFHPDWINIDMYPSDESVLKCNFLNGIPLEANYFDIVYHSHVLEHFTRPLGKRLIQECFRILKPGGILRMAFPDLEKIVKEYQNNIVRLDEGDENAKWDYDWILLEMYDQTVRNENGGEMLKFINNSTIPNREYVNYRIGNNQPVNKNIGKIEGSLKNEINNLQKQIDDKGAKGFSKLFKKLLNAKDRVCIFLLSKKERENLKIGRFRNNGEIHQWMYDRISIKTLLDEVGFTGFKIRSANESYIDNWQAFNLDNPDEHASLFVEAIKPA